LHVLRTFGDDYGNRLVEGIGKGPELVYDLIAQHNISCEARQTGLIFAAHTQSAATGLAEKTRFLKARNVEARILEPSETAELVGSRYYQMALLDPRGGTLNPLGYVRGLAMAAEKLGAKVFEDSRATAIRRDGNGWMVETAASHAKARFVVLATDAYTDDLWPGLRQSIIPLRAYQATSEPLSPNVAESILPYGHAITDTRRLYSGIRKRADGRLHLSVDGPAFSNDGQASIAMAQRRIRDVFPQIGDLKWPEQVAGWVGMTEDQYPHLHHVDDGVYAAVGLNGRGIAFGTLLGREVAKRILGRDEREMMLPLTPLKAINVRPFSRPLVGALINWYRLLDRLDIAQGYVGRRSA
jgi:glycine/D-amino acid oxidase-like deaminating enzyme